MGPVARAWVKAQDPALIRAIRAVFCEHGGGWRGNRYAEARPCGCLTEEDKRVPSEWVP
jgi:hypothetical protein